MTSHPADTPESLAALYFDGRSATARPVRLRLDGHTLHIELVNPDDGAPTPPAPLDTRTLTWPEHQRHGPRLMLLPDGAQIQCPDGAAWDRWARGAGHRPGWTVRLQQSWRGTLVALLVVLGLGWLAYAQGLPLLGRGVVALVPVSVDRAIGQQAFEQVDGQWLEPSRLPADTRQRLTRRLTEAMADHTRATGQPTPAWTLEFRRSKDGKTPGPNAFALPGGTMVITDELIELLKDREDIIVGVLAHEIGHVRRRHGMRLLVQTGLLGVATGLMFGDVSGLLGSAPLLLGQMAYSREFELQADDESIDVLSSHHLDPAIMATFFERLGRDHKKDETPSVLAIALSSHPADAERIARFRATKHRP